MQVRGRATPTQARTHAAALGREPLQAAAEKQGRDGRETGGLVRGGGCSGWQQLPCGSSEAQRATRRGGGDAGAARGRGRVRKDPENLEPR